MILIHLRKLSLGFAFDRSPPLFAFGRTWFDDQTMTINLPLFQVTRIDRSALERGTCYSLGFVSLYILRGGTRVPWKT